MAQLMTNSTVGGKLIETTEGAQIKVNDHENKKTNPHAVTADQAGAVALDGHTAMIGYLSLYEDPLQAKHAATKQYVDNRLQGFHVKRPVRAASTVNIAALSGLLTVDTVVLAAGDRVLVKNQTTTSQNGIYTAATGVWVRADDFDQNAEVVSGLTVFVNEGLQFKDSGFVLITDDISIVLGTDAVQFEQFSGAGQIIAGTGLSKNGNTLSLAAGSAVANIGYTPLNKAGDTMTGALTIASGADLTFKAVTGSDAGDIIFQSATSVEIARLYSDTTGGFNFSVGSPATINMKLLANGNFGIGLVNPTERLEVSGNIKGSGNIVLVGGTASSIGGALTVGGTLVANGTGLSSVGGSLSILGAGVLAVNGTGTSTFNGSVTVGGNFSSTGKVTGSSLKFANVTIPAGQREVSWTHNYGSIAYAVSFSQDNLARHVGHKNPTTNGISFYVDSPHTEPITLLVTFIGG